MMEGVEEAVEEGVEWEAVEEAVEGTAEEAREDEQWEDEQSPGTGNEVEEGDATGLARVLLITLIGSNLPWDERVDESWDDFLANVLNKHREGEAEPSRV